MSFRLFRPSNMSSSRSLKTRMLSCVSCVPELTVIFAWPVNAMSAPVSVTSRGSPRVVRVSLFSFVMSSARRLTEKLVLAVAITLNFGSTAWESHKSMSGESPLFMV